MRLYYFDLPGKAESIRLLLSHAGVKFDDFRIKYEDWPSYKEKFELKQVPVLEDNGVRYCQSIAILEFLGSRFGYFPKKDFCKINKVMFIINMVEDIFNKVYPLMKPTGPYDEATKTVALEKLLNVEGPVFMGALEKRLKENCCQKFIVGCKYTIADFALLGLYRTLQTNEEWNKAFASRIAEKYPTLQAYADARMKDFNPFYKKCKTKIYYFDAPGRAEMIRMMLKYLGLPFEDVRIKFEDWAKEKTSGKFELQQVPVVECEPCGVRLSQTDAIMHRIGARFGMLPTNKPEKLYKVIWWCNTAKDIMEGCFKEFLPIPAEKKKEMRTALFEKSVPVFLHAMEERLKMNKSQCTLVGRKYTIADFYLVGAYRAVINNPSYPEFKPILDTCPLLKAYFEKKDKIL